MDSAHEFVFNHVAAFALGAVALLLALAALVVFRVRRKGLHQSAPPTAEIAPPEAPHPTTEPKAASKPSPENHPDPTVQISNLAAAVQNADLAALLLSRMEDFEDEESEAEKAMILVRLLDEIQILSPSAAPQDAALLPRCAEAARQILRTMDAETVDDDAWTPERMRAIEVRRDLPAGSTPRIAEKVASGLILHGRIHCKQEVILRMPA